MQPHSSFPFHLHIVHAALIAMPTPPPAGNEVHGTSYHPASPVRPDGVRTCTQAPRARMWRADCTTRLLPQPSGGPVGRADARCAPRFSRAMRDIPVVRLGRERVGAAGLKGV